MPRIRLFFSERGAKLTFSIGTNAKHGIWRSRSWPRFWRSHEDRIIRVCLDMLLKILRTLEGLAAELALVRLQGNMNSDV